MPRGLVYMGYECDDGTVFQTLVDADEALDTNRGWAPVTPGNDLLPRGFRERRAFGLSAATGRTGSARIGSVLAPIWTGAVTTFDVEATDGTLDTMTVVDLKQERRRLSH